MIMVGGVLLVEVEVEVDVEGGGPLVWLERCTREVESVEAINLERGLVCGTAFAVSLKFSF